MGSLALIDLRPLDAAAGGGGGGGGGEEDEKWGGVR